LRGCSEGLADAPVAGAGVGPAAGVGDADADGDAVESADGREERNASQFPSGLQRGEVDDCGLVVNCHGARVPSVATIQIDELRRFCARSTLVNT